MSKPLAEVTALATKGHMQFRALGSDWRVDGKSIVDVPQPNGMSEQEWQANKALLAHRWNHGRTQHNAFNELVECVKSEMPQIKQDCPAGTYAFLLGAIAEAQTALTKAETVVTID